MTEEDKNVFERLEKESFELFGKMKKLAVFIGSERYKKLSFRHRHLLRRQFHFMRKYHQILSLRKKLLGKKMTKEEFDKKVEKYAVYAERFARGLVGAGNVKVGMMNAYRDGLIAGCEDSKKKDSQMELSNLKRFADEMKNGKL